MPGQVELYTSGHEAVRKKIKKLEKELNFHFVASHVIDLPQIYDRYKFLTTLTLSLTAIIGMEMPMVQIITKIDLLKTMGKPDMNIMFYEGCTNGLKFLFFDDFETTKDPQAKVSQFARRFSKMTKNMCEVIESYSQVNFSMCDTSNKLFLSNILMKLDKANNYWYQPQRIESDKENMIDYEAVEMYFYSSEWVSDLEDKYFYSAGDG